MDDQPKEPQENQKSSNEEISGQTTEQEIFTQPPALEHIAETTESSVPSKKKFSRKQIIITSLVVFLIAATTVAMVLIQKNKQDEATDQSQTEQPAKEETTEQIDTEQPATTLEAAYVLSDNIYLSSPKDLGNLNFYLDPETYFGFSDAESKVPNVTSEQFEYRQIGTTSDGRQIIVYTNNVNDFGGVTWNYALGKDGKYQLLEGINPLVGASSSERDGWYAEMQKALSDNVSIDRITTLKELDFPEETKIKGQPINGTGSAYYLENGKNTISDGQKNLTSLGEVDGLEILRHVSRDDTNFQLISMYGVYKNVFASSYDIKGEVSSSTDNELAITWTKGEQTKAKYFSQGPGCGTGGYILPKNVKFWSSAP